MKTKQFKGYNEIGWEIVNYNHWSQWGDSKIGGAMGLARVSAGFPKGNLWVELLARKANAMLTFTSVQMTPL